MNVGEVQDDSFQSSMNTYSFESNFVIQLIFCQFLVSVCIFISLLAAI